MNRSDVIGYGYDEIGNRTSMSDESGTSAYKYDENNRLTEIQKSGTTQITYSYDQIGNVIRVTDLKGYAVDYTYDKSSRMETVTYGDKTTTYTYDDNGRRTSVTYEGGVSENYTYDKDNNLITLANKKPNGGSLSEYTYTYDLAGSTNNAIRYTGEFYDEETGLYYLRARYYDPNLGRFTTEDSYWGEDNNPLSLNLYTYCKNDPVQFTDPSGHISIFGGLGGSIASTIANVTSYTANVVNTVAKVTSTMNISISAAVNEKVRDLEYIVPKIMPTDSYRTTPKDTDQTTSNSNQTGMGILSG